MTTPDTEHDPVFERVKHELWRRDDGIPDGLELDPTDRNTLRVTDEYQLVCVVANFPSDSDRYSFSIFDGRHINQLNSLRQTSWIAFQCGSIANILLFRWDHFLDEYFQHIYPSATTSYANGEKQFKITRNIEISPSGGGENIDVRSYLIQPPNPAPEDD